MSVHWPIVRRLATHPSFVAMVDDRKKWRSVEVLVAALHIASAIEKTARADTVGILLPTSGAFPTAALATWMLGKTAVPLNYLLRESELQYVVDDCGCDVIVASRLLVKHTGFEPRCDRIVYLEDLGFKGVPEPRWPASALDDSLAAMLYTSGTSGKPKGVMLTHGNLKANIRQCVDLTRFSRRDVFMGVLPQFHCFGFTTLSLLPLTIGARVRYLARFVPRQVLEACREERATVLLAIPSMYAALNGVKDAGPEHVETLRYAVSGAEPLPDATAQKFFDRFGKRISEGYGLTETAPVTNVCLPDEYKRHSVGRAVPDLEQVIVDPDTGAELSVGREGEIRMKGPNVMTGYFRLPEETAEAFDEKGRFRTGDIGRLDPSGHLYITGRLKEMMIVGGENVFPREIEEVLNKHPAVRASGATAEPDEVRGELPIAFVELEEGASADENELRSWCRERLAGYKAPRSIEVVEELPRGPTGKVLRRELLRMKKKSVAEET